MARFDPWVSCKIPPLAEGTYTVRYRASISKVYKYVWTGTYWLDDKGDRVPSLRIDFLKWYAVSRKNVSPCPEPQRAPLKAANRAVCCA